MRKGYLTGMPVSFLIPMIVIFISCNSNQSASESSDTLVATTDTTTKAEPAPLAPISGFLNILYIDAATFVRVNSQGNKKMTFRFFIKEPDSLTLSNWSNNNNSSQFPDPSNLTLWVGSPSTLKYGTGSYFGNLVLYQPQVNNILRQIRTNNLQYVFFVPVDPALEGGQITYLVVPTNLDPKTLKPSDLAALTGEQTNPSPPRNSF